MDDVFLRTVQLDLDAAMIGIGRARWVALLPNDAELERAAAIMRTHRFDVLPIDPGSSDIVREYFHTTATATWTRDGIVRATIGTNDCISAMTSIQDLIRQFTETGRRFFFLTHANQVAGLVSLANLNARVVQVWLFSLLAEFEVRLSRLVAAHLSESVIQETVTNQEVLARFDADRERGVENAMTEYLYLADLLKIARTHGIYQILGYRGGQFDKLNSLNEVRKQVMHPVRSLVSSPEAVARLESRLDRLYDALHRLRALQGEEE